MRRSDIHVGLEGQVFLVEDHPSEHFALVGVALFDHLFQHAGGVGHKTVQFALHHHPLLIVLIVGVLHLIPLNAVGRHLLLLVLTVVLTGAVVGLATGSLVRLARYVPQAFPFHVTLILFLYLSQT